MEIIVATTGHTVIYSWCTRTFPRSPVFRGSCQKKTKKTKRPHVVIRGWLSQQLQVSSRTSFDSPIGQLNHPRNWPMLCLRTSSSPTDFYSDSDFDSGSGVPFLVPFINFVNLLFYCSPCFERKCPRALTSFIYKKQSYPWDSDDTNTVRPMWITFYNDACLNADNVLEVSKWLLG